MTGDNFLHCCVNVVQSLLFVNYLYTCLPVPGVLYTIADLYIFSARLTQSALLLATVLSVCLSVCHTCEPSLRGSRQRNTFDSVMIERRCGLLTSNLIVFTLNESVKDRQAPHQ